MALRDALLPEFERELANTRRLLERIPEDKLAWKPHPKSGALGWLAAHLANIPGWAVETIGKDSLDLAPPGQEPPRAPQPESRAQILEVFDSNVNSARGALASASDELLSAPWTLLSGGNTIFTMPRTAVLRSFVMNHLIHHRAQLGLYLRLNDVPLPPMYGPTADESAM